jgi:hypothetical protein
LRRFYADLKRAGIPKLDPRGRVLDVHSLRTTFGTHLALAGVPLTTAQKLMRHADPKLTANVYTDAQLLDLHGAVEALPPVASASVAPSVAPAVAPIEVKRLVSTPVGPSSVAPSVAPSVALVGDLPCHLGASDGTNADATPLDASATGAKKNPAFRRVS